LLAAVNQNEMLPPPSGNLEAIFQDSHSQVFATAYRMTGSAQDAEDVLQTVFLRLLRRQDDLDLSPSPGSYLHRAAVNASLDLIRSRARSRTVGLDDFEIAEGSHKSPDRQQQGRELRGMLRQAVLTLTPKSAEIFSLRFLEDCSNREIAKTLGMSQTAVGVALHRARAQVKKEIRSLIGEN
jgi:RNA polymerase sigma-70 factor (ECF subfamily)